MGGSGLSDGAWNAANQRSYRRWIDNFAAGIGSSRVGLVVQPDLPFALCAHSRVPLQLVSYAARRFIALPPTTVHRRRRAVLAVIQPGGFDARGIR